MKKLLTAIFGLLALVFSTSSYAVSDACYISYIPAVGYQSPNHQASWDAFDYLHGGYIFQIFHIPSPYAHLPEVFGIGATAGSTIRYLLDPANGTYTIQGSIYAGEPSSDPEYFAYEEMDDCSLTGDVERPTASVTISPKSNVPPGTSVSITWSSTNASNCYYNGSPIGSSGNTTIIAKTSNAGTYTATCTGANGSVNASDSLSVAACIVSGSNVDPITPYSPDPYGVDITGMTSGTQTALSCLTTAVQNASGTLTVTSAYRPDAYQAHLREAWDKKALLNGNSDSACAVIKSSANSEVSLHSLITQPATTSNHSSGLSFDASVALGGGYNIDTMAAACTLVRPNPTTDPVHFTYSP